MRVKGEGERGDIIARRPPAAAARPATEPITIPATAPVDNPSLLLGVRVKDEGEGEGEGEG